MMLSTFAVIAVLIAVALTGNSGVERESSFKTIAMATDSMEISNPQYVGSKKCRMCHMEIYKSWEATKHSKAGDVLAAPGKDSADCIVCHTTGVKPDGKLIPGVGCEVCHGPGSEYRKMRVMKNFEAALQHGLVLPDSTDCIKCHNATRPAFKGFDYDKARTKGVHLILSTKKSDAD